MARVQRRLPGVETTEVEAHMASYSLFATDHERQAAHRQYKFRSRIDNTVRTMDHEGLSGRFRAVRAMPKRH